MANASGPLLSCHTSAELIGPPLNSTARHFNLYGKTQRGGYAAPRNLVLLVQSNENINNSSNVSGTVSYTTRKFQSVSEPIINFICHIRLGYQRLP
jgi:hypothetical protein